MLLRISGLVLANVPRVQRGGLGDQDMKNSFLRHRQTGTWHIGDWENYNLLPPPFCFEFEKHIGDWMCLPRTTLLQFLLFSRCRAVHVVFCIQCQKVVAVEFTPENTQQKQPPKKTSWRISGDLKRTFTGSFASDKDFRWCWRLKIGHWVAGYLPKHTHTHCNMSYHFRELKRTRLWIRWLLLNVDW